MVNLRQFHLPKKLNKLYLDAYPLSNFALYIWSNGNKTLKSLLINEKI